MPHFVEIAPTDPVRFGHKATILTEVARLGAPVPPSFTISAELGAFLRRGEALPMVAEQEIQSGLASIEARTGLRFGDPEAPLLLSVRSGAERSMPGMLHTVLDVGIGPGVLEGLARRYSPRLAAEAELHFLRTYGEATIVDPRDDALSPFATASTRSRRSSGVFPLGHDPGALQGLKDSYLAIYTQSRAALPPSDPREQLYAAIRTVFASWDHPRARDYRETQGLSDEGGSAVTVMAMVYGNLDPSSAIGVIVTRDPTTGEDRLVGEHMMVAQGHELASGTVTPDPFGAGDRPEQGRRSLEARAPAAYQALCQLARTLEQAFRIPLEIEFTVERGTPWILQARAARLAPSATVRAAVEMMRSGALSPEEAVARIEPRDLTPLLTPTVDPARGRILVAKGLAASAGAATGMVCFSSEAAEAKHQAGQQVILVRPDTSPNDVRGIRAARGVITGRGGTTSHAAVVARSLGKVCVVGTRELSFDLEKKQFMARGHTVREGDVLTVDGETGEIFLGSMATKVRERPPEIDQLLEAADKLATVAVYALVRSEDEARMSAALGAPRFFAVLGEHASRAELEAIVRALSGKELVVAVGRLGGSGHEARWRTLEELARRSPQLRLAVDVPIPEALGDVDARSTEWLSKDQLVRLQAQVPRIYARLVRADGELDRFVTEARGLGLSVGLIAEDRLDALDLRKLSALGVAAVVVPTPGVAAARLAAGRAALEPNRAMA